MWTAVKTIFVVLLAKKIIGRLSADADCQMANNRPIIGAALVGRQTYDQAAVCLTHSRVAIQWFSINGDYLWRPQ